MGPKTLLNARSPLLYQSSVRVVLNYMGCLHDEPRDEQNRVCLNKLKTILSDKAERGDVLADRDQCRGKTVFVMTRPKLYNYVSNAFTSKEIVN